MLDHSNNDTLYKSAVALVEADSFAIHALWLMNAADAKQYCNYGGRRCNWQQIAMGHLETVGFLDSMPVTVCLSYAKINNRIVAFWHSPSVVSDHRLINKWFDSNLPADIQRTDANNFHNAVNYINELNK